MTVLAELLADARYRYRVIDVPLLPLGLGVLRQRTHRLTGRVEHFWRFADEVGWQKVRPAALGLLPRCTTEAQLRQLISARKDGRADSPGTRYRGVVASPGDQTAAGTEPWPADGRHVTRAVPAPSPSLGSPQPPHGRAARVSPGGAA
jgi:hypothetical protein